MLPFGFFTISNSDRRTVRQINSGKIPVASWDLNSQQKPSLILSLILSLTNVAIQICVEWDVLNEFSFMFHFTFRTWVISGINRV